MPLSPTAISLRRLLRKWTDPKEVRITTPAQRLYRTGHHIFVNQALYMLAYILHCSARIRCVVVLYRACCVWCKCFHVVFPVLVNPVQLVCVIGRICCCSFDVLYFRITWLRTHNGTWLIPRAASYVSMVCARCNQQHAANVINQ